MDKNALAALALAASAVSLAVQPASAQAAPTETRDPLDTQALDRIQAQFRQLIALANKHDFAALHDMFWQSPSALIVAKSAVPADGDWAGYWGNAAIDAKIRAIGTSGPTVLAPDYSRLKVVGLTPDVAESYAPLNITVSYAGQDGLPEPFLLIVNWIRVGADWKVAAEILLPVPHAPAAKG